MIPLQKKTNEQTKTKTKQERESQIAQSKHFFFLKEGRVEGERRKSRKFWLENQMVRIIPFRKL